MRNILGHRSWNKKEVVGMLTRTGAFTCCNLPHWRYNSVKLICRKLKDAGLIYQTGRDKTCINYAVTDKFKRGEDLV